MVQPSDQAVSPEMCKVSPALFLGSLAGPLSFPTYDRKGFCEAILQF